MRRARFRFRRARWGSRGIKFALFLALCIPAGVALFGTLRRRAGVLWMGVMVTLLAFDPFVIRRFRVSCAGMPVLLGPEQQTGGGEARNQNAVDHIPKFTTGGGYTSTRSLPRNPRSAFF